jgi:molybdopterin adenylyltransferase
MIRTALLSIARADDAALASLRGALGPGFLEVAHHVLPEAQAIVRARLRLLCDEIGTDLILTIGGIGVALRDRVPEATQEAIDRPLPGLAEAMRAASPPAGYLTRGLVGIRRHTLIANLPDDPALIAAMLSPLTAALPAAVAALTASG